MGGGGVCVQQTSLLHDVLTVPVLQGFLECWFYEVQSAQACALCTAGRCTACQPDEPTTQSISMESDASYTV